MNAKLEKGLAYPLGIILPIIYLFLPKLYMCFIIFAITTFTLYPYINSYRKQFMQYLSNTEGNINLQNIKKFQYDGAKIDNKLWLMLAFLANILIFSRGLSIVSLFVTAIADNLARIVGREVGTILDNGKSVAGAVSFFISALMIGLISYSIIGFYTSFFALFVACFISCLLEFYANEIGVKDNILILLIFPLTIVIINFF